MNLELYKPSEIEQWIEKQYRDAGIFYASDLEVDRIAEHFYTEVHYVAHPKSFIDYPDDFYPIIAISAYGGPQKRREDFFHELGHLIQHSGDQRRLPKLLSDLFEREANQFLMFSAMPVYMLEEFKWVRPSVYLKVLTEEFGVSEQLVKRRIEQIRSRILDEELRLDQIRRQKETNSARFTLDDARKLQERMRAERGA